MSLAYKVEELLALRDSASESAVSLDKFADEDVIKEHVLRPTASANLLGSSEQSFQPSVTPAIPATAANKKTSPSPSIKRGKAERLLKEHGSPPGMRVTAGGRVVPSDLPPLGTSRFPNNASKPQIFRGVTPGNSVPAPPRPDTSMPRVEVIGNQAVICVGDRMFALPSFGATNSNMSSAGPGFLDAAPKPVAEPAVASHPLGFPGTTHNSSQVHQQSQFAGLDLSGLKTQQTLKRQELRTVEQTEVLQAGQQSEAWRTGMIEKKKNLIVELDALRKQISALEADSTTSTQSNGFSGQMGAAPATAPPSTFVPPFQQPVPQPLYAYGGHNPYASMMMYQPPFGGFAEVQHAEPPTFVPKPTNGAQSPESASRRSHAIEIKPPREEPKKQVISSALDPKSPTYEPAGKPTETGKEAVPPTPSPAKRSPWRTHGADELNKSEDRVISPKPSLSSIDTTDFFPTNTHEHSSTRLAPKTQELKQSSKENTVTTNTAIPCTPEKNWPASPWNEGNSSRSRGTEPRKELTSWPVTFGKQPSLPSLKAASSNQIPSSIQEQASLAASTVTKAPSANGAALRKSPDQRTGTEDHWPFSGVKVITHVPSTYQEGFQAGYDHVGIPGSPEVLRGYVQGLIQFISDEAGKDRNNSSNCPTTTASTDVRSGSLRGLVASSAPHDSAISMTFNRSEAPIGSQENNRSAKSPLMARDVHKDPPFNLRQSGGGMPISLTLANQAAQDTRMRIASTGTYSTPADFSDRVGSGHRTVFMPESETNRNKHEHGNFSGTDAALSTASYPRQLSGNQVYRAYGTPFSGQRYYPAPKEITRGYNGEISSARSMPGRPSGLDGAMDGLAEFVLETRPDDEGCTAEGRRSKEMSPSQFVDTVDSSGCKPFPGKGKQRATASPTKGTATSSPANQSVSPRKSGEHSPAKNKLETVTNKFRRSKRDDPRYMSPEEKRERSQKWHKRFQRIKNNEIKEINQDGEKSEEGNVRNERNEKNERQ